MPSAAAIPLVMLRGIWPALTEKMFAGVIVSALCMAGAVVQLRSLLRDIGASRGTVIILVACFALNPMVIAYGANGMSEAMYLLFLIGTVRVPDCVDGERATATARAHRHQPRAWAT